MSTTTGIEFYTLPEHLTTIRLAFDKANARLASFSNTADPLQITNMEELQLDTKSGESRVTVLRLTVNWALSAADWTVAGLITPINGDTDEFTYAAFDASVTATDITDPRMCDHCGIRRNRSVTFLLVNNEGETMQVGSSCMEPRTGLRATKSLTNVLLSSPLDFVDDTLVLPEIEDDPDWLPEKWESYTSTATEYPLRKVLAVAAYMHHTNDLDGIKYGTVGAMRSGVTLKLTDADQELADQVYAAYVDGPADDSYLGNLAKVFRHEWINRRQLGLVASAVPSYLRAQEWAKRDRLENGEVNPEPWAAAKTKITKDSPLEARLVRESCWETEWGEVSRYTFRTKENHELTWKTGTVPTAELVNEGADSCESSLQTGDVAIIQGGSVKEIGEYLGKTQTVLTRVRLGGIRRGTDEEPAPFS